LYARTTNSLIHSTEKDGDGSDPLEILLDRRR